MPISFHCPQCGKPYTTSDETAGKRARCKQCGNTMTIPRPAALDPYALNEPAAAPRRPFADDEDEDEVLPQRATYRAPKKAVSAGSGGSTKLFGGGLIGFVAIVAVRIVIRLAASQLGGKGHKAPEPPPAPLPAAAVAVNPDAPVALPAFPDVGPGRTIEPGVELHEIHLPGGPRPGFGGKLWLYLPSGAQPDKSLPCVLIAGAGSNLMVGMDLGDGDRPEHLPYVRAGFAVLAFELDGAVPNLQAASDAEFLAGARQFLAARAGLVNAHVALEYALAKVPQVDPGRLFAAGHSSAGTLALLFAEHEPRLKGCVAYAPVVDVARRLRPATALLRQQGLADLVGPYSPKTSAAGLACPLFLFHAQDDTNVPASSSVTWARQLQQLGKSVTLDTVPTGNHYDSMIQQGIPRAIAWIQAQSGQPVAGPGPGPGADPVPTPVPTPAGPTPPPSPPPAVGGFPARPRPPHPGMGGFPPPPGGPRPGFRGPRARRPGPGMRPF